MLFVKCILLLGVSQGVRWFILNLILVSVYFGTFGLGPCRWINRHRAMRHSISFRCSAPTHTSWCLLSLVQEMVWLDINFLG